MIFRQGQLLAVCGRVFDHEEAPTARQNAYGSPVDPAPSRRCMNGLSRHFLPLCSPVYYRRARSQPSKAATTITKKTKFSEIKLLREAGLCTDFAQSKFGKVIRFQVSLSRVRGCPAGPAEVGV